MIHYVFSGKGTLFLDDKPYPVRSGECFLICPDDNASYIADKDDPWRSGWIGFRGKAAEQLKQLPSPVFSISSEIFEPLLFMSRANGVEDYLLLSILYKVFAEIFTHPLTVADHAEAAELYLRQHFRETESVAALAKKLGITPRYLSSLFKQKYGKTIQRHLLDLRLGYARNLLMQGYSVKEASFEAGYSDPFVFSRAFRHHFGVPPKCFLEKKERKN